jgi:DNA-binding transcriptional ArsR family regulator
MTTADDLAAVRDEVVRRYAAVSEVFAALASPLRAAMVHLLTVRARSVTELATELGISQPLASQHLRTLRSAGLVEVERVGRSATYRLVDQHVAHVLLDAYQHSREPRED